MTFTSFVEEPTPMQRRLRWTPIWERASPMFFDVALPCSLDGPFTQTDGSSMFGRAIPVSLLLVRYVSFFDFAPKSVLFCVFLCFFFVFAPLS